MIYSKDIGDYFEEKAVNILEKEGFEILNFYGNKSIFNYYDLEVIKDEKKYIVEVKGSINSNIFFIKKTKLNKLIISEYSCIILLINYERYEYFILKDKINEVNVSNKLKINSFTLNIINDKYIDNENISTSIIKDKINFISETRKFLNENILFNAMIFKKNKEFDTLYLSLLEEYIKDAKKLGIYNILNEDIELSKKAIINPNDFLNYNDKQLNENFIKVKVYLKEYLKNKVEPKIKLVNNVKQNLKIGYNKTFKIISKLIEDKFLIIEIGTHNTKRIKLNNI